MNDAWMGWRNNPDEVARLLSAKSGSVFLPESLKDLYQGEEIALWRACKKVNNNNNLPADKQEIGDCVSHGSARGIDYLWCIKQAAGLASGYKEGLSSAMSEAIYGEAREIGNDLSTQDGAVGIWAIEALQKFGFALRNGTPYSAQLAKNYGYRGVPSSLKQAGRVHLLEDYAKIQTIDDYLNALKAGSPVVVCSNQGFKESRDPNGVCTPFGVWNHCMLHIGTFTVGAVAWSTFSASNSGRYGVILQSWGQNRPDGPVPCDDAPDNSFGASLDVVARMLAQGDSYALSAMEGWEPVPPLDWIM